MIENSKIGKFNENYVTNTSADNQWTISTTKTGRYIHESKLAALVEKWRKKHKDEHYYHASFFADELENLLRGE